MQKRGQVTVFIILGIALLMFALALIYLNSYLATQEVKLNEENELQNILFEDSIKEYVHSCILSTTEAAILANSYSGGYFILPEKSTENLFDNVPYYSLNDKDLIPSNQTIANEIAKYVDAMLNYCMDNFTSFQNQGYKISEEKPQSKATLTSKKIIIRTNYPLTFSKGSSTTQLFNFIISTPAPDFHQNIIMARKIIENQDKKVICLTCFSNLAFENDMVVNIFSNENDTSIFEIENKNYLINNENVRLRFATK
ncbi:hypothetical protein HOE52_00720 [Candidatus Woesearchaeota archaeon]|nr:hypothetical protein [Candidatus Woesearchaeota archaeon]